MAVEGQCHRVKLRRNADEALRQGIVNLPRQAHALLQHEGEAPADLPQAQPEQSPNARRREQDAQIKEPGCFIEMRKQLEGEGCFAPRAPGDAGSNHEAIVAMPQAVVVGDAARDGAHPVPIETLPAGRNSARAPARSD